MTYSLPTNPEFISDLFEAVAIPFRSVQDQRALLIRKDEVQGCVQVLFSAADMPIIYFVLLLCVSFLIPIIDYHMRVGFGEVAKQAVVASEMAV